MWKDVPAANVAHYGWEVGRFVGDTPKYKKPPVVETVIGVQFPELRGFHSGHFGLYWREIQDRYPRCEEKDRLGPAAEPFPRKAVSGPALQVGPARVPNRMWYVATSGSELIQVQPDRYLFNWRERPGEGYSSYEQNSQTFLQEFDGFRRFCEESGLELPTPNLCDVTYINHIVPERGESAVELFAKVFTGLEWQLSDDRLAAPEVASFNRVYVIDEQAGRLYAEASIAYRPTDTGGLQEFVALRMTGRVLHRSQVSKGIAGSLQLAHEWVVNGFASITDPGMQRERWEKTA